MIPTIVQQHLEEAASLHDTRRALAIAPHATLEDLGRFDERLAAHLDGLSVAGESARPLCDGALENLSSGTLFTLAVLAIERRELERLLKLFAVAEAVPEVRGGLIAAVGWLESSRLKGIVKRLLSSQNALEQVVGLVACVSHSVDPGLASGPWIRDKNANVRARALRAIGELNQQDLAPVCASAMSDEDRDCQFWAAASAVLLGNRGVSLEAVARAGTSPGGPPNTGFEVGAPSDEYKRGTSSASRPS